MILYLLALSAGCVALYFGGDLLVRGAIGLGHGLGVSPALVGLIFVSLGTSAPELFVSAGAALQGFGDVAVGNALGSNIVNLCLVLGLGASFGALSIERGIRDVQLPFMLALTLASVFLVVDGQLGRPEGLSLLVATALGLAWIVRHDRRAVGAATGGGSAGGGESGEPAVAGGTVPAPVDATDGESSDRADVLPLPRAALALVGGVVVLLVGAEGLIWGGVGLAAALGVPDAVIALTVTSIGTGLPEITATVLAAARGQHAMAVANVVGSNIMNLGLVLGGSALLRPIASAGVDARTFVTLVVLSIGLLVVARTPGRVTRPIGLALLALYALYVLVLIV